MNFFKIKIHFPDGTEEIRDWLYIPKFNSSFWTYHELYKINKINNYERLYERFVVEYSSDKTEIWLEHV